MSWRAAVRTDVADRFVCWRRVDLQRLIAERFSVLYHERTVGKILRQLGRHTPSCCSTAPVGTPQAASMSRRT